MRIARKLLLLVTKRSYKHQEFPVKLNASISVPDVVII